jgi:uncharacterized protein with FMN-binding domain
MLWSVHGVPTNPKRRTGGGMPWRSPREKAGIVVLSAAVIASVYGAGFAFLNSGRLITPPSTVIEQLAPMEQASYRDGTYSGTATNRFGGVSVAVTITSGRISRVEITGSDTFYPQSYIDGLPDEVVRTQRSVVPAVSGATASWDDFVRAVQQALRKAEG